MTAGTTPPRTPDARRLAERALARLLGAVGERWPELVVIGGLVPQTLVAADVPHQGTADVDLVIDLALRFDRDEEDYGWLERGLDTAGFDRHGSSGWQWVCEVDGNPVIVDLLVDVPDSRGQEIVLPGTSTVGAMNLIGPAAAFSDSRALTIGGVTARFAGVGGYLVAKAAAITGRGKRKDYYDFAFVVVEAMRSGADDAPRRAVAAASRSTDYVIADFLLAACDRFLEPDAIGPEVYAAELVASGSAEDEETLALDAIAAIAAFRTEVARLLGRTPAS